MTAELLPGALEGLRVVEFAQNAAIPHCGRMLAGLGADVIKVEPPEGDAMRRLAQLGDRESKAYATINPGKRSMAVDLAAADARPVIDALFRWAEVALVAFKLPDLERYGIDWDAARRVNPQLIHLTHSALGPHGPDADQGGYDALVQGRSGVGFIMNRSQDGAPMSTRPAVNDFGSGFVAAFAVLAGLRHRDATGEGQRIDTSLLGTAMSLGTPVLTSFPGEQERFDELDTDLDLMRQAGLDFEEQRALYESRVQAGGGAFQLYFRHYLTADGLISLAALSPGLFAKFHEVTGVARPQTIDITDPSFLQIVAAAEEIMKQRTSAEWLTEFRRVGFPCGPYNLPHQAIHDPHAVQNGYVVDLDHPGFGTYRTTGMPFQMERNETGVPGPSPAFAEHTRQVLGEIGFEPVDIDRFISSQVVAAADD